jgi:hypothetical protein
MTTHSATGSAGGAPVFAYLDANAVEDIESLRCGVDASMVEALGVALRDGRLLVPLSPEVAMELMASGGTKPYRALDLGRVYYALASESLAFKPTKPIVGGAIEQRLGGPALNPFVTLTLEQRGRVRARLLGEAPNAVGKIIDGEQASIQNWLDGVKESAAEFRALSEGIEDVQERSIAELVADLWKQDVARDWARGRAESNGLLERIVEAGLTDDDLLAIPTIAAVVGVMLGLAMAHGKGRKPRFGDYRDAQHCMLAASAGAIFVTNDGRLTEIGDVPIAVES